MSDAPDFARLVAGHARVLEAINAGRSSLPVLEDLMETTQAALHADGMSLTQYSRSGGRVVAATGSATWSLGRPVEAEYALSAVRAGGPKTGETRIDDGDLAAQWDGRGLRRLLYGRCVVHGMLVGTLQAFYADPDVRITPEHHTVIGYVASCIAHSYGDHAGLPVHGDGPVVDALADGLAIVDAAKTVRLWNPAAERLTGRDAPDVLGRRLPLPVPPAGQAIDHQLPNGRWLKITSGELLGSLDSMVVTFRDATDQRRREHDRALFVAVTSHELRTPVTVIKGYADTLVDHWEQLPEPARREAARVLGQRARELARLVDRLLAADNAVPVGGSEPAPFDLVDALRFAVDALPGDLRQRLAVDLPEQLATACGDRASLTTVLTELATNAGKYSAADAPIELTAGADLRSVWFRVSDRGIGVRPEHVELAFERFWQGERGDRRQYSGTGLGLYLVRRIVERQKGWVSLRPRSGGGTVAEVRLPRAGASAANARASMEHGTGG